MTSVWRRMVLGILVVGLTAAAQAQMPDARQMSGIPLPSGDVPKGSVSIRLVRGSLDKPVSQQRIDLHVGGQTQAGTTDAEGRVVFAGLQPGIALHAVAEVDGERVESQEFALPPEAGIRMVLVAGAGSAGSGVGAGPMSAPASAAVPGEVALGGDSRIQIEFDDDTLEVFYLLELVNGNAAPVNPKGDLVFELPAGAEQASLLEGSSTQALIKGRTVSISGPFSPGTTPIQLAFSLAPSGSTRTLSQVFPVAWLRPQVIVTQVGAVALSSPQLSSTSEMPGQTQPFLLGVGGALASGREFTVSLTGLPSRSHTGRYLALAIAVLVIGWGLFAAFSAGGPSGDDARRAQLVERRDRLMADLVRVEEQFRSGTIDKARRTARHDDLVAQLERIYGELDEHPGSGQGLPA